VSTDHEAVPYSLSDFERPSVAADVVIFRMAERGLSVLLIQRKDPPYAERWAVPGGFVNIDESLDAAAKRELEEETGISGVEVEQLYTFGEPGRDPRGRVITVAYLALVPPDKSSARSGDDAADAAWFELDKLPPLAFDHDEMLRIAMERFRHLVKFGDGAFRLLPREFTLSELQRTYETALGEPFDKRNFRRRMIQSGMLIQTGSSRSGEGRPARTYTYKANA
jgi:8-oxo-dGTP diphosphatase